MKDRLEIICEYLFELRSLSLQKRVFTKIEYLFTEQLEDIEGVLTFGLGLTRRLADIGDEILPRDEPLLFYNRDQSHIQLGDQVLLRLLLFILRHLQNQLNNALSNALLLLIGKHLPPGIYCIFENLKRQEL